MKAFVEMLKLLLDACSLVSKKPAHDDGKYTDSNTDKKKEANEEQLEMLELYKTLCEAEIDDVRYSTPSHMSWRGRRDGSNEDVYVVKFAGFQDDLLIGFHRAYEAGIGCLNVKEHVHVWSYVGGPEILYLETTSCTVPASEDKDAVGLGALHKRLKGFMQDKSKKEAEERKNKAVKVRRELMNKLKPS